MNTKIRVAVTGASGLLGRPLMKSLTSDPRFEAHGAAFSRAAGGLDRVDLTSTAAVEGWLDRVRPDVVVHLTAERRPDVYAADPDSADRLNIGATEALAKICAAREVNLLFLSTDYVFDGTSPPYSEEDKPNPLNDYGRSKLAGERAVAAASAGHRILRVPILHGPSDRLDESAVTVVARGFLAGDGPVLLDDRQIRYPAFTPDIARAVAGLLPDLAAEALPGPVLHFSPEEAFTKRGMGEIIARIVGADPARAVADTRPPTGTARPENAHLACPRLKELGLAQFTPFRQAVRTSLESIREAGGLGIR
jgi:dTDP-4-dehydrorhamnose reductase